MNRIGPVWAAVLAASAPVATALAVEPPAHRHGALRTAAGDSADLPRITTHTRQYCHQLSARAAQLQRLVSAPIADAAMLAAEGDRLCAQGQVRPGIMRLRRAIALLRAGIAPGDHRN